MPQIIPADVSIILDDEEQHESTQSSQAASCGTHDITEEVRRLPAPQEPIPSGIPTQAPVTQPKETRPDTSETMPPSVPSRPRLDTARLQRRIDSVKSSAAFTTSSHDSQLVSNVVQVGIPSVLCRLPGQFGLGILPPMIPSTSTPHGPSSLLIETLQANHARRNILRRNSGSYFAPRLNSGPRLSSIVPILPPTPAFWAPRPVVPTPVLQAPKDRSTSSNTNQVPHSQSTSASQTAPRTIHPLPPKPRTSMPSRQRSKSKARSKVKAKTQSNDNVSRAEQPSDAFAITTTIDAAHPVIQKDQLKTIFEDAQVDATHEDPKPSANSPNLGPTKTAQEPAKEEWEESFDNALSVLCPTVPTLVPDLDTTTLSPILQTPPAEPATRRFASSSSSSSPSGPGLAAHLGQESPMFARPQNKSAVLTCPPHIRSPLTPVVRSSIDSKSDESPTHSSITPGWALNHGPVKEPVAVPQPVPKWRGRVGGRFGA